MKKKITKIWGVGLTLVLAATLLLSAAPASAGELDWGTYTPFPSTTGNVLVTDNNGVADIAVAEDGTMFLASTNSTFLYKSTNGGKTWSKLSENFSANLTFVAVAPDDSDIVATSNGTEILISKDGGSSWGNLGTPDASGDTLSNMYDLAVSNADGTKNYIGVAGDNGTVASIWWFDLGATAPAWASAYGTAGTYGFFTTGQDLGLAVTFSPNVASDKVMIVVTAASGAAGNVTLQMMSMSTKKWNTSAGFDSYPVEIQNSSTSIDSAAHARIAVAPDYLGSDDSMRVAFVGISTAGANAYGGVYRMKDTTDKAIDEDFDVWSIDYDGTNLVAGSWLDNKVRRSDNALATDPDFSTASSYKRPGGLNKVIVAWSGSDVIAGMQGKMSAFAISADNGASFNDISFIDTESGTLGEMLDVDVSPDGSKIYMVTRDAKGLSLWRYDETWARVFTKSNSADDFIVRLAPEDPDAVYLSMAGSSNSTTLYFSQEGGDTKWFLRSAKYAIQDMAVESADVAYAAVYSASTVSKTSNSGFTWDTAESTGITGDINMIRSLGEDKIIIGSDSGYVAWSSDSNDSWDTVNTKLNGSGDVQATATGLADGDYIYAATNNAATRIERWEIGQSGTSWKNLEAPTDNASDYVDCKAFGMALVEGVLYVQTTSQSASSNGTVTFRTLNPDTGEPAAGNWATMIEDTVSANVTPQSLKTSAGSTKLWSVDTKTAALYVYEDTLGVSGPTLTSPADGSAVTMNPVSGKANAVSLTWKRISKAKIYDVKIALDSGFTEIVKSITTASTTDDPVSVVVGPDTDYTVALSPDTTYYWRVRVNIAGPIKSAWSETRSFTIGVLPEIGGPPVIIQQPPAPVISVPQAPAITITPPQIVLPPAQAVPR